MQFTDSVCPTVHYRDAFYGKTRSLQANYNLQIITVNFLLPEHLLWNTYSPGCFLFHESANGTSQLLVCLICGSPFGTWELSSFTDSMHNIMETRYRHVFPLAGLSGEGMNHKVMDGVWSKSERSAFLKCRCSGAIEYF